MTVLNLERFFMADNQNLESEAISKKIMLIFQLNIDVNFVMLNINFIHI